MPVEHSIPSQEYQPGTLTRSVNSIPQSRHGVRVSFTRESWPEGDVARFTVTGHRGVEVFVIGPFVLAGGVTIGKDGQPSTVSVVSWEWPGVAGPGGGRLEVKITDVDVELEILQVFRTAITVETF